METNDKKPKRQRIRISATAPAESNREGQAPEQFDRVNPATRPYQPRQKDDSSIGTIYQPRPNSHSYQPKESYYGDSQGYEPRGFGHGRHDSGRNYTGRSNDSYNRGGDSFRSNRNYQHSEDQPFQRSTSGRLQNNRGYGSFGNRGNGMNNRRPMSRRPNDNMQSSRTFVPRPKPVQYDLPLPDPNEQLRLNKFMANSGICSRREADEYIKQGLVKVNGKVVTELGTKITHSDNVEFDEKLVALEKKTYILLNKPKDCVTTSDDPHGRLTVLDLVKGACNERIYPVGRLDRNTTGVLLLTNDGDLASKLTHPKYVKKKIYHVWCDRNIAPEDMQRIADGVELEDGVMHADAISYATPTDRNQAGIEIHSGQNRVVRRLFEKLGYHVTKLDRVYFAGLTKKNLPRGRWRYLTQQEVSQLKRGIYE